MIRALLKLSVVAGIIGYTIYGAPSARKRDAAMWAVVIECENEEAAKRVLGAVQVLTPFTAQIERLVK